MSRPAPCTFAESHFSLWSVRNAPAKVPVPTTGTWCILQALTCIRLSYFYPAWLPEFPVPGREELGGDWRRFNPDRSEEIGRGSIKPVTQSWSAWRRAFLSCASSCVSLKPCLRFYGKKKVVLSQHLSCSLHLFLETLWIRQMQDVYSPLQKQRRWPVFKSDIWACLIAPGAPPRASQGCCWPWCLSDGPFDHHRTGLSGPSWEPAEMIGFWQLSSKTVQQAV